MEHQDWKSIVVKMNNPLNEDGTKKKEYVLQTLDSQKKKQYFGTKKIKK